MKHLSRFLFLFALLISIGSIGQEIFVGDINSLSILKPSIYPTNDKGWIIYSSEDAVLLKQNQCGEIEWAKDFDIDNSSCCIGDEVVISSAQNITILTREYDGSHYGYRVTQFSNAGTVNWSKVFTNPQREYYPYALLLDNNEDLIIYGNETQVGGGPGFMTVNKLDQQGNTIWTKQIDNGVVWGAALATRDNGCLIRSGDKFIKLDVNGNIQWFQQYQAQGTYYYIAPIEVDDGYIFTKNLTGGSSIGFFKIDKSGNLLWPNAKFANLSGNPLPLRKTGDNTFVSLFSVTNASDIAPVIIEFDKDLNVLQKNGIGITGTDVFISDFRMTSNNFPIITGNSGGFMRYLIYGKLNYDFTTSCDFSAAIAFTDVPVIIVAPTVSVKDYQFVSTDAAVSFTEPSFTAIHSCSFSPIYNLEIGSDTIICPGDSLILTNQTSSVFDTYLWSTGEKTESISTGNSGTYWVETRKACNNTVYRDTIIVDTFSFPDPLKFITDTVLCGTETILLDASISNGSYKWQDGSSDSTYMAPSAGVYFVDISSGICEKRFTSNIIGCEKILIPNIFTPNGDGVNDFFEVKYYGIQTYSIEIYNRWGGLVFKSENPGFSWDGNTSVGVENEIGVYFYVISVGDKSYRGSLTLLK